MEGGVAAEEISFEGAIGGEREKDARKNGFQQGMRIFFFKFP